MFVRQGVCFPFFGLLSIVATVTAQVAERMDLGEERKVDALVRELVQGPLHEVCELPDIYDMQQIPTRKPRAVSGSRTPDSSNLEEPNDRPPDE